MFCFAEAQEQEINCKAWGTLRFHHAILNIPFVVTEFFQLKRRRYTKWLSLGLRNSGPHSWTLYSG